MRLGEIILRKLSDSDSDSGSDSKSLSDSDSHSEADKETYHSYNLDKQNRKKISENIERF